MWGLSIIKWIFGFSPFWNILILWTQWLIHQENNSGTHVVIMKIQTGRSHNITDRMLSTWALLSARLWLRPRPRTAIVAVVCAGLPLVGEVPGLRPSHVSVRHHHHQGPLLLLLVFTPLALLLLPLLRLLPLYGQCCLYWAGTEHGEVCQAAILVHQSEDIWEVIIHEDLCMKTHQRICISILMRTFSVFTPLVLYLWAFFRGTFERMSEVRCVAVPPHW